MTSWNDLLFRHCPPRCVDAMLFQLSISRSHASVERDGGWLVCVRKRRELAYMLEQSLRALSAASIVTLIAQTARSLVVAIVATSRCMPSRVRGW